MSDGEFIRYGPTWNEAAVRTLLADLEAAGLSLAHPATGAVTFLRTEGPDIGSREHATSEDISRMAALADRDVLGFYFWFADGVDMYCRVRRVTHSLYASEFELGGMADEQHRHVIATVLGTIRRAPADTTAFVVDRSGWGLEVDWDAVVQGAPVRIGIMPTLLGLPPRVADAHPELGDFPRQNDTGLGELVAIGDLELLELG
jgi:hypothetical protein